MKSWCETVYQSIESPCFTDFTTRGWARVSLQFVRGRQFTTFVTPAMSVDMCFPLSWWSPCTQVPLLLVFSQVQPHNLRVPASPAALPHGKRREPSKVVPWQCRCGGIPLPCRAGNTYLWHTEPHRMTPPPKNPKNPMLARDLTWTQALILTKAERTWKQILWQDSSSPPSSLYYLNSQLTFAVQVLRTVEQHFSVNLK